LMFGVLADSLDSYFVLRVHAQAGTPVTLAPQASVPPGNSSSHQDERNRSSRAAILVLWRSSLLLPPHISLISSRKLQGLGQVREEFRPGASAASLLLSSFLG